MMLPFAEVDNLQSFRNNFILTSVIQLWGDKLKTGKSPANISEFVVESADHI